MTPTDDASPDPLKPHLPPTSNNALPEGRRPDADAAIEASYVSESAQEQKPKSCPQCGSLVPVGTPSVLCPRCLLVLGFESQPGLNQRSTQAYRPQFVAPLPEQLAPYFPQLEILERVGYGGMGVVYKARQRDLDRLVALKILRPDFEHEVGFAERFQREAQALARLNHPHIVTVYDFGKQADLYFFLMEFVDGANLRHIEQTGRLSPSEALCIVPQVCDALQYAHEQGVVHRDIKPENILIGKDGRVKIADFGLAKLAHPNGTTTTDQQRPLTGTREVVGTPHYMAPEQVEHPAEVDHRADIFSLGVVLYEMLTGELPLGRFPPPSRKVQIDLRLDEVVLRALEKEPAQRYQRVTEVRTDVERIRNHDVAASASNWFATGLDKIRCFFASWVAGTSSVPMDGTIQREQLEAELGIPATALTIVGAIGSVAGLLMLIFAPHVMSLLTLVGSSMALQVGLSLKKLQSYRFVVAGSVIVICLFGVFWIATLPFAVWVLLILKRPEVRQHFGDVPLSDHHELRTFRDTAVEFCKAVRHVGRMAAPKVRDACASVAEATPAAFRKLVAVTHRRDLTSGAIFLALETIWTLACSAVIGGVVISIFAKWPNFHLRNEYVSLIALPAGTAAVCWICGTLVLLRFSGRLLRTTEQLTRRQRIAGPTEALLAMMLVSLVASILVATLVIQDPYGHQTWHLIGGDGFLHSTTTISLHLIFDGLCLLSLALLHWTSHPRPICWSLGVSTMLYPTMIGLLMTHAETGNLWAPFVPMLLSIPIGCWAMIAARRDLLASESKTALDPIIESAPATSS